MKRLISKLMAIIVVLVVGMSLASCVEHTHIEEIIPEILPTCTENGYTEGKKCSDCGEILVAQVVVPSTGHKEIDIPTIEPTCTENGSENGKKCSVCDEIIIEPQVILARHTEEKIPRVEPGIAKTGYTEGKKCSACETIFIEPKEITLLSIDIHEKRSSKGKISCDLMLNQLNGEFSIYYASEEKEKLPYFNTLARIVAGEENRMVEFDDLVLPSGCEYIVATDGGEYTYFVEIPEEYLLEEKNFTYSSMSDIHCNRAEGVYFEGALDFLDKYGKIDFVAISGDVADGEAGAYTFFNQQISERAYKVYTTTGNHDETGLLSGRWLQYMNTTIKTDKEVFDIGENGLDFVYIPEKSPDSVFVFFCQTSWSYPKRPTGTEYSLVTEEQLEWLSGVLEKYRDKTVLLYFHTFLSDPNGNQTEAVGNLKNPGGYSYDLPFSYGAADEVAFRALMKEYKNVVYFSGHSHWMFELEIYNENLNISNFDGEYCYMVHNPSVGEPRWIGENDTRRTSMDGEVSEGWIVEIYDEAMILIPVDFISETFYTEYMEIIPLS